MAAVIPVTSLSDIYIARRTAKDMAVAIGFDDRVSEEIALAVIELASNLARHAQSGKLTLASITDGGRVGIQVEALDRGPGIANVQPAMTDGFSMAGSLGYGLGMVNRLMDQFDITSQQGADAGTSIVCTRWLRVDDATASPCPLEFGTATRTCPTMTLNGDAFVIKRWQACALASVIDGLGHGQYAHRAAQTARQYVETHFDQPLDAIFHGVGRACHATRGVVMALVRFDFGQHDLRFAFASVGNIATRLFGSSAWRHFIVQRGILGGNAPIVRVTEHCWEPGNVLVLHSDGVTQHWGLEDFPELAKESATVMAQHLLRALAKTNDDATVLVVKGMAHER
jgi:anti-sigma regulatory factor (Ser/Thr protein kinase)